MSLPAALDAFLSRWNGLEIDPSTFLWGTEARDRDVLDDRDEPECANGFVIGELLDVGYLFMHGEEVWFYDYNDPPPVFRVAPNLASFLRDALRGDLDLLGVVERARELASRHA